MLDVLHRFFFVFGGDWNGFEGQRTALADFEGLELLCEGGLERR